MTSHFSKRTISLAITALGAGLGLVLAVLFALGTTLPAVHAAEIDGIDTTTDDLTTNGNCTLREAIQAANTDAAVDACPAGSGADIIHLPAGIYTLTLAGADEDDNATGDLDITAPLTIAGAGPEQTIINANGLDRVLDIHPGAGTIVISGVTIFNGNAPNGGGIYNADAALTIEHGVIVSNVATGTLSSGGGGLYVLSGTTTLNGGQIISNSAEQGGGVCVYAVSATLDIIDEQINHNSAKWGGGLYIEQGSVTLSNTSTIFSNTAAWAGGAYVLDESATLNINEGQVISNTAKHGGGGILVVHGSVTMSGGQISANSVPWYGAGVYVYYGSVTLSGVQISGNTTVNYGGGIYVDQGNATVNGGQIISNSARDNGGGIYIGQGDLALNGGQIVSNTASLGGGVHIDSGSATLSNGQIISNTATDYGGGVYIGQSSAVFTQTGTSIIAHNVASSGGGVYVDQGRATVSEAQISDNTAPGLWPDGYGGGLHIHGGSAVISGGQITGNEALIGGGGVYVCCTGHVTVSEVQIISNTAGGGGALVVNTDGQATVTGGQIISNSADHQGGGVSVYYSSLTLIGGLISGNTSGWRGGGLFVADSEVMLSGSRISDNSASRGSGLHLSGGTITSTVALTIAGNVYQDAGVFNGGDDSLRIHGTLHLVGGEFRAPTGMLEITGPFTHTGGTYRQARVVSGTADVGFPKVGGLILNAGGHDLGRTEVVIQAGKDCTTVREETVRHCYTITPTTPATATVTFFFNSNEPPPNNICEALDVYRWDGEWSAPLAVDERQCASSPYSVRVTDVANFSPFVLKSGSAPTIVALQALAAHGSTPALLGLGVFILGSVSITRLGKAVAKVLALTLPAISETAWGSTSRWPSLRCRKTCRRRRAGRRRVPRAL